MTFRAKRLATVLLRRHFLMHLHIDKNRVPNLPPAHNRFATSASNFLFLF